MKKNRGTGKRKQGRNDETRETKGIASTSTITFSFANFLGKDTKDVGQTWDEWDHETIVALLKKLSYLSTVSPTKAKESKHLKVYGPFPEDSEFTCPTHLTGKGNWGVILKLGHGWKNRVAGYYDDAGVFNIIFLDMNHQFWPTER